MWERWWGVEESTIFLVHLADFDIVFTASHEAIVCLVEVGCCCDAGSWDLSEGVEEEIVDNGVNEFQGNIYHDAQEEESGFGVLLEAEHLGRVDYRGQ